MSGELIGDAVVRRSTLFTSKPWQASLGDLSAQGHSSDDAIYGLRQEISKRQAELARILGLTELSRIIL